MRRITFEQATARYVHRFTCDHVPAWALKQCGNGRHYAPQFRSDREWYEHTKFPGEDGCHEQGTDCYTSGQTWPLGQWLDAPYRRAA